MTAPRIIAHRLIFLLLLPGCHTWRPVTMAPSTGFQGGEVRVERKTPASDSVVASAGRSAGKSHAAVVFNRAWVDGDSLYGYRSGSAQPVAIAVADVRRAEERRISTPRTTGLVVGIVGGGFLALIGLALASMSAGF